MSAQEMTYSVGDALPVVDKTFSTVDLMAYGAATWDWYRVHYDLENARSLNFPNVFVDGQQYGAMFARQACDYFGPQAFVSKLAMRFHNMTFAGDRVIGTAEVTAIAAAPDGKTRIVSLEQRLEKDGKPVASCKSEVRLPL